MRRDPAQITPRSGQTEVFDNSFNIGGSRCWGAYLAASGGIEEVKINTSNGAHVALVLQANHTTQFSYSIDPGSAFQIGTTAVTFTATDKANNSSSCTFDVTVSDTAPPTISCPDDMIVNATTGLCTAQVDYSVTTNDDCSNEVLSQTSGLPSGSDFPVGVTTNTLVVTDASGQTATCSFLVTVNDIELPVANCQNMTLQLGTDGNSAITTADIDDNSTDNCTPLASLELDQTDFDCTDVGSNTVILTATDNSNNSSTCQATVWVEDNIAPTAICQDQTVQLDASGNGTITENEIDNGSDDACGLASLSLNTSNFNCANIGANQIILTVLDNNNNSSTCGATVTVEDNIAPMALCQDQTIQLDANGNASTSVDDVDNNSTDACGLATITLNTSNFICTDLGNQIVTLTATDNNGNSNTCTATITVQDPIMPIAICNNLTINLPDRNTYNLSPAEIDAIAFGSSDNCSWTPSISSGTTSYDCTNRDMDFTLTLTVTDMANNASSCQAIISIRDPNSVCNDPPVAVCQNLTVYANSNCEAMMEASELDGGSSDPDLDPLTFSMDHGSIFALGTHNVILTVSDGEFTSSCSTTVTVEDITAPTISCPGDLTLNTDPGNCSSTFTVPVPNATDNCEVSVLRYRHRLVDESGNNIAGEDWSSWSTSTSTTLGTGNWKIQWQAKDPSGNQNKCTYFVEVIDEEAPQPVCINPIIEFNGEASINLGIEDIWNEDASSDNCSGGVFFVDQSIFQVTCDQVNTTIPVVVTVEDLYGNTSTCTANVEVIGLPCGWWVDPTGLGCNPGQSGYSPSDIFSLSSEDCYDPNYYRANDAHGFIQSELCGDGTIIAQVTNVSGGGWAGISMRESNDPAAPMIQLMIDGTSLSRRELRQTAGGYAFVHMYPTNNKNWLRLSRAGNQFTASRSLDGINWEHVFITQIPMSNCIEVGLITMNGAPNSEVTGTFENVQVGAGSTGNSFVAPIPSGGTLESQPQADFSIYPNPAVDEVTVQIHPFIGETVDLKIYNLNGQVVQQKYFPIVEHASERLNISTLDAGTYIVEIQSGGQRVSKKLVVGGS